MPGPGATDTADVMAQARAELGLTRQLEQPRRVSPPPSSGTGFDRAMDQFPREDDAAKWQRNNVIVRVGRVPWTPNFYPT
jgi:hypothetical protein